MPKPNRTVSMSVLPGQPTDGSGKVCIHLFVRDEAGPFVEPHVLHPVIGPDGQPRKQELKARRTRGRLACSATRTVAPVTRNGVTTVTARSDDPHAVTCHKCIASPFYKEAMAVIETPQPEPEPVAQE